MVSSQNTNRARTLSAVTRPSMESMNRCRKRKNLPVWRWPCRYSTAYRVTKKPTPLMMSVKSTLSPSSTKDRFTPSRGIQG